MSYLRTFALLIAMAVACVTATACAPVLAALPTVIAAVVDAGQIVDTIEAFVDRYFQLHPDPAKQAEIGLAVQRCRLALNVVVKLAEGSQDLDDQKIDQAFDEFKQAYVALLHLVAPYGVKVAPKGEAPLLTPSGDALVVPPAEAFKARAQ